MEQLQKWLATTGTRQSALAERLDISKGYMSSLVSGRQLPSLELAVRLQRLTEGAVPADCWIEPEAAPSPNPATEDAA